MSDTRPVVFIVDDDPGVGRAVHFLLGSVGIPAESYLSGDDFLEAFDPERPGCLVLDVRMPGMSGVDLQARLHERGSTLPIIFVTAHGDVPMAVEAVKAGALDFIQKPFRDQELLDKIQEALAVDSRVRAQGRGLAQIKNRLDTLTPREAEVLEQVVSGHPNAKIAQQLAISQRTVEIHRARVMEKMNAQSLANLVRLVMKVKA